jgi:hypothetical protein
MARMGGIKWIPYSKSTAEQVIRREDESDMVLLNLKSKRIF